jgi:hypothetical protein
MEDAECPMCHSSVIEVKNVQTTRVGDDVEVAVTLKCKRCNGSRRQAINGIGEFWRRIKSISIGLAKVEFNEEVPKTQQMPSN